MGEVNHTRERRKETEVSTGVATEALLRLEAHEELCGERYKNIEEKIDEIKETVSKFTWAVLAGMASILVKLLFFT